MGDKTLLIIITVINIGMWLAVIMYMSNSFKRNNELYSKQCELEKKQMEYYHTAHQGITQMIEMNIQAMGNFIQQISSILEKQGIEDATESRE